MRRKSGGAFRQRTLILTVTPAVARFILSNPCGGFCGVEELGFNAGDVVLMWVGEPMNRLLGGFTVRAILDGLPDSIWAVIAGNARIEPAEFMGIYRESERAHVVQYSDVFVFWNPPTESQLQSMGIAELPPAGELIGLSARQAKHLRKILEVK